MAEVRPRESEGRERREEEPVLPVFKSGPSLEDAGFSQAKDIKIAAHRSQAKTKWLLAVAFALIAGIGVIWFALHKERTLALTRIPTEMPTSTPPSLTEAGVLAKGVVTIQENQWCDLERGIALPNEQDEKRDLTWRRGSLGAPVLKPYSGTGIIYLKQEIREEYFEKITKRDISGQNFISGKIVVASSPSDTVYLQSNEIYFYFIHGTYYGKFRVESKTPDLVISFVTFK